MIPVKAAKPDEEGVVRNGFCVWEGHGVESAADWLTQRSESYWHDSQNETLPLHMAIAYRTISEELHKAAVVLMRRGD